MDFGLTRDGSKSAPYEHGQNEYPTTIFPALNVPLADEAPGFVPLGQPTYSPVTIHEPAPSILPFKQPFEIVRFGRLFAGYKDSLTGEPDGVWELDPATRNIIAIVKPPKEAVHDEDHEFHVTERNGKLSFSGDGNKEKLKHLARKIFEESEDEILDKARVIVRERLQQQGISMPTANGLPAGTGDNFAPQQSGIPDYRDTPPAAGIGGLQFESDNAASVKMNGLRASGDATRKLGGAAWRNKRAIASAAILLFAVTAADRTYAVMRGGDHKLIDLSAAVHLHDPFHDPLYDITVVPCKFIPGC
jgi:hypothetical protein